MIYVLRFTIFVPFDQSDATRISDIRSKLVLRTWSVVKIGNRKS